MATMNLVVLVGRLTRDPEVKVFQNGGKVTNFGLAVVGSWRKNAQTGATEEDPCFLDCKAFNSQTGRKLADVVESYCRKGHQVAVRGHLVLEKWKSNEGQDRQAIRVICDEVTLLTPKDQSQQGHGQPQQQPPPGYYPPQQAQQPPPGYYQPQGYPQQPPPGYQQPAQQPPGYYPPQQPQPAYQPPLPPPERDDEIPF